jgi:outer membrane protein OmpA-like peptidoglycan-associated protein
MHTRITYRPVATLGLALSCAWLSACSTPPGNGSSDTQELPVAAEPAPVSAPQPAGMNSQTSELRNDLAALGLEVSQTAEGRIKLNIASDVSFGLGSAHLKSSAAQLLKGLAAVLIKHPESPIEIIGHTDATGSDAVNLPLSAKRAESTRDYLIAQKVAADRFTTQGWGSDQPVADNKTAAGRAANRRVEVFITEH